MKNGRERLAVAGGIIGLIGGVAAITISPAIAAPSAGTTLKIYSASNVGPIDLTNGPTIAKLTLPAGRWLVSGKMWADSIASSTPNLLVGCSLSRGSKVVDVSAINVPKVGGSTSAASAVVGAAFRLRSTTTVFFKCNDFGSHANAHWVALSAIGG